MGRLFFVFLCQTISVFAIFKEIAGKTTDFFKKALIYVTAPNNDEYACSGVFLMSQSQKFNQFGGKKFRLCNI